MKVMIISVLLFTTSLAGAVSYPVPQSPKPHEETGFAAESMKLQELLGTGPQPGIPKTWKLIGVSPGEKQGGSNLWYQDVDGSVYLLQVGVTQNRLIFHDQLYKIPAR